MHVHLLNSKSTDPLSRQISLNKLEFCMLLLVELQAAYDSAGVFRGVFLEAIRRVAPEFANRSTGLFDGVSTISAAMADTNAGVPATTTATGDLQAPSGLTFDEGFFDELMGQGSISSFWEWVGSTEWNV